MIPADLIGTAEASRILRSSQRTVKRLALSGALPPAVKMPGDTGAYLFDRAAVVALARSRAGDLAAEAAAIEAGIETAEVPA